MTIAATGNGFYCKHSSGDVEYVCIASQDSDMPGGEALGESSSHDSPVVIRITEAVGG